MICKSMRHQLFKIVQAQLPTDAKQGGNILGFKANDMTA
jgi:hypothetical protein